MRQVATVPLITITTLVTITTEDAVAIMEDAVIVEELVAASAMVMDTTHAESMALVFIVPSPTANPLTEAAAVSDTVATTVASAVVELVMVAPA